MPQLISVVFLGFFIFLLGPLVSARLAIPSNMNKSDRATAVEILGLSSAMKVLGNPFPLGGYAGVEIGLASEVIPTSEISRLGGKSSSQGETAYSTMTIGKGLYNNIDVLVQLTPFTQDEEITNFGGQLRWGFYQAQFMPAHLSFIASSNSVSYQNLININTTAYDFVGGFTVDDMTLFVGVGAVNSRALFMGGPKGVTDSGQAEDAATTDSHFLAGVDLRFNRMFLGLEFDRYAQTVYSAKLGFRF